MEILCFDFKQPLDVIVDTVKKKKKGSSLARPFHQGFGESDGDKPSIVSTALSLEYVSDQCGIPVQDCCCYGQRGPHSPQYVHQ